MANVNPDAGAVQNALAELFPLKVRVKLYALFVLLGLLIAIVALAWAVFGDLPSWLAATSIVYNFLSSGGFLVARANVGTAGLT